MYLTRKLDELILHRYWQRTGGTLGLAVFLGIGGGFAAALFKGALGFAQEQVLHRFAGFPFTLQGGIIPHWLFFLVPAAGGLLAGLIVFRFSPDAAGAGTDALIDAYHNRGGHIPFRTAVVKFFASVVTIGSGGSAGQEGPMAQIGGGLGSLLGRAFRLPDRMRRILLLTGTAAGLGAIFHAPLGAALTAAEIVYREDFESQGFLPFTVASVVAFAVFSVITHQHTTYLHFPLLPLTTVLELVNFAFLGLCCVPVSFAFISIYRMAQDYFSKLKVPAFCKPAIGGLLVGLLAYIAPEVVGANWTVLSDAVGGKYGFPALLAIAGAKILATSFTIGSGGSGGVFGPSLFIGGMTGGAVGFGLRALDTGLVANPGSYVLVGMGAFFAGAAKAPLAGLIMVCEITGNYGLLAPLLLATTVHLSLSRKWTLYQSQRQNKFSSPMHEHALKVDVLKHAPLDSIFVPTASTLILKADASAAEAYDRMIGSDQEVVPVVSENGIVIGLVTTASLHLAVMSAPEDTKVTLEDMMTEPYALEIGMDLRQALSMFLESRAAQLPVLGKDGEVIGLMRMHEIMAHYNRMTETVSKDQSTLSGNAKVG